MSNAYQEFEMKGNGLVDIHVSVSHKPEVLPLHSHTFYEIIFISSGNLNYLLDGKRYRIRQGDILLIPPGISHRPLFLEELDVPYERISLMIAAGFWAEMTAKYPDLDYAFTRCRELDSYLLRTPSATWSGLKAGFYMLVREASEKKLGWELCMNSHALALMLHIGRTLYYQGGISPSSEKHQMLDDIFNYINNHYQEPISLDFLADRFLVSKSTISHLFQQKLGISFYHCVIQRRLIGAKNSMLSGTRIHDVWEPYGFADYSSFYRAFKKEYGISPSEFVKQNRR